MSQYEKFAVRGELVPRVTMILSRAPEVFSRASEVKNDVLRKISAQIESGRAKVCPLNFVRKVERGISLCKPIKWSAFGLAHKYEPTFYDNGHLFAPVSYTHLTLPTKA